MGTLGTNAVSISINKDVEKYTEESILQALEMIGLKAESYAKMKCPVDTGLLRNSIAHAVAGEVPSITISKDNDYKANKPNEKGEIRKGTYTGHTPKKKANILFMSGRRWNMLRTLKWGIFKQGAANTLHLSRI